MEKLIEEFLKAQLPLNSPDDVHPDDKGTAEKCEIFPWEDVKKCMDDKIEAVPNHLPCPICGKPSEELDWICFSSPGDTRDRYSVTLSSRSKNVSTHK